MFKTLFNRTTILTRTVALVYMAAFIIWSVRFPIGNGTFTGAGLQFLLIVALFAWRMRKRAGLPFIPDEMLVCLPYFWALANCGSAQNWFACWKLFLLPVFAVSMLAMPGCRNCFVGGLRSNSLLQAIFCSIAFVALFANGLHYLFPSFNAALCRVTMLNLIVFFTGIPISLAAFYWLLAKIQVFDDRA